MAYATGSICLYREQPSESSSKFVIDAVKALNRARPESTTAAFKTGVAFLPNGSFVAFDKDKSITLYEEKRANSGGCACCSLF